MVKSAAVLYVRDLGRMESFYRACFGMDVVDQATDYTVLESEPLTLSLVQAPEEFTRSTGVSVPPRRRDQVPIKLAFGVGSIDDLRPRIAESGGAVDPVTSQWEFRGGIHCDAVDPEGNIVQLVEPVS